MISITRLLPSQVLTCWSIGLIVLLSGLAQATTTSREAAFWKHDIKTVVIDAGHGGHDPGCHGKKAKEKEVTLAVATQVAQLIEDNIKGVKVVLTRDEDNFVELNDRAAIANKHHADVFISIHCNSGSKKVDGSETYCMGLHTSNGNLEVAKRENSVILLEKNYMEKYEGYNPNSPLQHIFFANLQNAHLARSLQLAGLIEGQFKSRVGRKSRGVKQAGFLVLWKTAMPAVLCEIGYLTNPNEEKFLASDSGQEYIASAIYRAFKEYKAEIEG